MLPVLPSSSVKLPITTVLSVSAGTISIDYEFVAAICVTGFPTPLALISRALISSILNFTPPSPDEPISKCVKSYAYTLGAYV